MAIAEFEHDNVIPFEPVQRKARVRGKTISMKRFPKARLEAERLLNPDLDVPRPETRADCVQGVNAERPCPFVSCKYHLFLDVNPRSGAIKVNFPNLEVWEMTETCALDVADRGGVTLEDVGALMNITRERVRQLETKGVSKLKTMSEMAALMDYCGEDASVYQGSKYVKRSDPPDESVDRSHWQSFRVSEGGFTSRFRQA